MSTNTIYIFFPWNVKYWNWIWFPYIVFIYIISRSQCQKKKQKSHFINNDDSSFLHLFSYVEYWTVSQKIEIQQHQLQHLQLMFQKKQQRWEMLFKKESKRLLHYSKMNSLNLFQCSARINAKTLTSIYIIHKRHILNESKTLLILSQDDNQ